MGLMPKDAEGRTAWDYGAAIWNLLGEIRDALGPKDEDRSVIRWLSLVGDAYAGGGLVTTGSVRVPVGCNWTALALSASSGSNGADIVEVFRNSISDQGFIGRYVGAGGRVSMVNLPDNLVLQENTLLIARVTILAAADGAFPTVNIATREVQYGRPPQVVQERGESIAQGGRFEWPEGDDDRIARVEYADGRGA